MNKRKTNEVDMMLDDDLVDRCNDAGLTESDMNGYVKGEFDLKKRRRIKDHILECPLLSKCLSGACWRTV